MLRDPVVMHDADDLFLWSRYWCTRGLRKMFQVWTLVSLRILLIADMPHASLLRYSLWINMQHMQIRKLEYKQFLAAFVLKLMPLFGTHCPPSALTMTMMLPLCTIRPQICHHCQGFVLWFLKFISLKPTGVYSHESVLALLCWKFRFTRPVLHLSSLSWLTSNATPRLLSHIPCHNLHRLCNQVSSSPSDPLCWVITRVSALCHTSTHIHWGHQHLSASPIHHMLRWELGMSIKCNSVFRVFMISHFYSKHYLSALHERHLQKWIYHDEMHIYQITLYRVVVRIDDCVWYPRWYKRWQRS